MDLSEPPSCASSPYPLAEPTDDSLHLLAENMPPLAWMADATGRVFWFNGSWLHFSDAFSGTFYGCRWREILEPQNADNVIASIGVAFQKCILWEDTIFLRGRDGMYRCFSSRIEPILDGEGTPVRWIGIHTDITQQRAFEAQAHSDAERMHLALTAGAVIGTWFWDLTKNELIIDKRYAEAVGITIPSRSKSVSYQEVTANVHPGDKAALDIAISEAIALGGRYSHQYRVRRNDGRYHWVEANGTINFDVVGNPASFAGVLKDVTQKQAINDSFYQAAARLNAVLNNTKMAVFFTDINGLCVYVNAAALDRTGYGLEHLHGYKICEVLYPREPDGTTCDLAQCPISRALTEGIRIEGERFFLGRNGEFFPVAFSASPMINEEGALFGAVLEAR